MKTLLYYRKFEIGIGFFITSIIGLYLSYSLAKNIFHFIIFSIIIMMLNIFMTTIFYKNLKHLGSDKK